MRNFLAYLISGFTLCFIAQCNYKPKPEIFIVDGNKVVLYEAPKKAEGKPWVWYSPTLRGDIWLVQKQSAYFNAFIKSGISMAGYDIGDVRGAPGSTAKQTLFYNEMVKRGFSKKPILLGQSRGGLVTLAWAFRNPEKVRAWVGIYPVCNLASWPMTDSKTETLADYGITSDELSANIREFNPIDNLAGLALNNVPMFAVHGDSDSVVPYNDNTKLLKERYEAAGGTFTEKVIHGAGHEVVPSFFECPELITFVLNLK